MKRRKFTAWLTDPNDERIFEIPSPVPGLPPQRFKVEQDDGCIKPLPIRPAIFLLPNDMFAQ